MYDDVHVFVYCACIFVYVCVCMRVYISICRYMYVVYLYV